MKDPKINETDVENNVESDVKTDLIASSYNDDEIGSHLTQNYIKIPNDISIKAAMKSLVSQASDHDNISVIYVVDSTDTLMGAIDLNDLIIAREGTSLSDIMRADYPFVYGNATTEDCIDDLKDYAEKSIPVVDRRKRLLGCLMASTIAQLVDEELGEDYAKLAGLSDEEDLHEPVKKSIIKRLPWLIVLLFLGLIVSNVVGVFEGVISHLAIIVIFQSLVLDMAGNVGTQSLAVTIRILMDEQVSGSEKRYLVAKEARVGFLMGLILASIAFVGVGLYLMITGNPAPKAFSISLCVGAALLISMFVSSITGTIIPIIFKKCGVDPAVASGPLITTVNDLVAVCIYYGLAWIFLIDILHL